MPGLVAGIGQFRSIAKWVNNRCNQRSDVLDIVSPFYYVLPRRLWTADGAVFQTTPWSLALMGGYPYLGMR